MKPIKKSPDLKRIMFEPVAPYFADAYIAMTSMIQALALSILGYEMTIIFFEGQSPAVKMELIFTDLTPRIIVVFVSISVLWHRYITHNQFYAWRLGILDTIIPVGIGLAEVLLTLSISKDFVYFSGLFAILSTLGMFAYMNTNRRHFTYTTRTLYRDHFSTLGPEFADAFFDEVTRFERKALTELIVSTTVFWVLQWLITSQRIAEQTGKIIFFTLSFCVLAKLLFSGLWNQLEKSPRLQEHWKRLASPKAK